MIRLRHVIQTPGESAPASLLAEFDLAQRSIQRALETDRPESLELVAAHLEGERPQSGPWNSFVGLHRDSLSLSGLPETRRLPFLADVVSAFGDDSAYDFGILTNADIALHPLFYSTVSRLIERDPHSKSITRRSVYPGVPIDSVDDLSSAPSTSHPGHDCIIFPSRIASRISLGHILLGAQFSDIPLIWSLRLADERFRIHGDLHLTFHLGDDRGPLRRGSRPFALHNLEASRTIIEGLRRDYGSDRVSKLKHISRISRRENNENLLSSPLDFHQAPPPRRPQFRGLPRLIFIQHSGGSTGNAIDRFILRNNLSAYDMGEKQQDLSGDRSEDLTEAYLDFMRRTTNSMHQNDIFLDTTFDFATALSSMVFEGFDNELIYVITPSSCITHRVLDRLTDEGPDVDSILDEVRHQDETLRSLRRSHPFVNWIDIPEHHLPHISISENVSNPYLLDFRSRRSLSIPKCRRLPDAIIRSFQRLVESERALMGDLLLCSRCSRRVSALTSPDHV